MIVTCDKCQSRFNLDETLIKESGAKVQCSNCRHVFMVHPVSGSPEAINIDDVIPGSEGVAINEKKETALDLKEIDLSDIIEDVSGKPEKGIEEGIEFELDSASFESAKPKKAGDELELEFDLDGIFEEGKKSDAPILRTPVEETQDLDLSNLEEILEIERQPKTETKPKPVSIEKHPESAPEGKDEIRLETDEIATETGKKKAPDQEIVSDILDEIDLSEFQIRAEEEKAGPIEEKKEEEKEEELELEFKIDVEKETESTQQEPAALATGAPSKPAEPFIRRKLEEEREPEEERERPAPVLAPAEKKGLGLPALIGLIIVLVGGAVYGAYVLMNRIGIHIPYVGNLLQEERQDSGNLKITPLEADGKFVQSETAGKLFVIRGRVKNDYPNNRSFVQVTGKLISKNKQIASTKTTFAGNMIPDSNLSRMDTRVIESRLANHDGDNKSNTNIKPGQIVPFMIVFTNLPEDLDQFSVEIAGSQAGK